MHHALIIRFFFITENILTSEHRLYLLNISKIQILDRSFFLYKSIS